MKKVWLTITITLILIGLIGLSLNLILGNSTVVYITKTKIQESGLTAYQYNFWEYISNLKTTITDTSILSLEMPTRTWQAMTLTDFGIALGNNLALILDYIILAINALLYPLRIGGYLVRNGIALVGVNMDTNNVNNGLAWLINIANFLTALQIPLV